MYFEGFSYAMIIYGLVSYFDLQANFFKLLFALATYIFWFRSLVVTLEEKSTAVYFCLLLSIEVLISPLILALVNASLDLAQRSLPS